MGTSVLHIKTEVECRVYLFDEEKGIAKSGTYFNLEVRKGEQDLIFVSTEDEDVICFKSYNVEEDDCDYRMTLGQSQFINVNAEVTEEELSSGVKDEFGVVYSHDGLQLLECQNYDLGKYHIRDGCKVIRNGAFCYYVNVGWGTFLEFEKLIAISLPDSITHIGKRAFYWCVNLTTINFPASLISIGSSAFCRCNKITAISLPTRLKHIGESAFLSCDNLRTITLPASLTDIGSSAFRWCKKLTAINLPASLTYIGSEAFSGTGIRVVINHSPNFTFIDGCLIYQPEHRLIAFFSEKDKVSLPIDLISIGWSAFEKCNNLTDITLPPDLKYIGYDAFHWCKNLNTITLPNSLTQIGYNAFDGCKSLSQVNIPVGMRKHFEGLLPKELHGKLTEINTNGRVGDSILLPHYIFFDTETTGVPRDYKAPASNTRNWPRLVQLGWIVTDDEGNVLSQGNEIVKPEGFVIPADAARVHGITTERAQREGKPLREVIEAFLKDAKDVKCIVGHNISFDQKVVGAELYRLGIPDTISTAKSLCTMQAGTDFCKIPGYYGYKWPKLQELHYKLFGCDFEDAHDAMADITATKKCFFEMRKRGVI